MFADRYLRSAPRGDGRSWTNRISKRAGCRSRKFVGLSRCQSANCLQAQRADLALGSDVSASSQIPTVARELNPPPLGLPTILTPYAHSAAAGTATPRAPASRGGLAAS